MSFRPPRRRKVQKQGALVGQFEDAALLRAGVGKGALFVAEELAFQQRIGNGGAVDGNERFGLASAFVVQRLGDQVFAGSVFAFQQNGGGFTDRYPAHEVHHLAHGRGLGDDRALLRGGLFGDVLDSGDHAGELPGIVEHLVGAHHHQPLHTVIGVQPDGGVGRRGRLV
jgi:hypothetical protein